MSVTERPPDSPPTPLASIELAMEELRRLPRSEWLDLVRSDQSHRWRQGQAIAAEAYFQKLPELRADAEDALVVINGEIMLRSETTDSPQLEDYTQRFPDLGDRIAIQFEVNRVLATPLDDTLSAADDAGAPEAIQLPGYEFLDQIGSGASGVVYRARQQSLGRDVAIKVVPMPRADSRQIARQRQEAAVLARLRHPNIVHIYEVHEAHGCLHLVMEFAAGTTLAERIKGRALAPDEAARLAQTLAEAVHAVHEAGVLHRDLKPANVLQSESGELKITDFGLAKLQSSSASLTAPDSILGTPSYMAPEQALGNHDAIGPTADVYSLGAILYEMLTGRPPFLGATVLDTLSLLRSEEPVAPRQLQPRLSRDLETICLKCLGKSPQQRYATAAALADDLGKYLSGMPIAARRSGAWERAARWAKRRPAAAIAIACLFAVIGVVAAAWRINAAQQRRLSDAALVESIATADSQSLPQLLDRLTAAEGRAAPLVREALAASKLHGPKWVNLSIAELAADPAAPADALLAYLPSAHPAEIRTITPVLAQRSAPLGAEVWRMLLDDDATDEARLKLACLAAQISPADARWKSIAPAVSRALVSQHPLDISAFTTVLRPARKALVPALVDHYGDAEAEPIAREVAAGILARFASDDPQTLAELIVDADAVGFRLLIPALHEQAAGALPDLKLIADKTEGFEKLSENEPSNTRHAVQQQYDLSQRRRATALAAMWRLGDRRGALAALRYDAEPALRSWLIEVLGPLGITVDELWTNAADSADSGVRQALLLAMGQTNVQKRSAADRDRLAASVAQMYRDDSDAGVHAACLWLLENRLQGSQHAAAIDAALSEDKNRFRQWLPGPNGHTFAVFRGPIVFAMGSPSTELTREDDEAAHQRRLDYSFAVGTKEVTCAQFLKFRDKYFNRRYSATDDCPANNVTWFDAAAYCRWLSEQAGLPEDQMCYPAVDQIVPGMRLSENWRERTGYRLPTEAEWEYACRGGVGASRFCGEGKALLGRYAWFVENSDDHAWPVGRLKPNNFGLFDVLGNVTERCQEALASYPSTGSPAEFPPSGDADLIVEGGATRAFRGANFGDTEHNLRSARRNANGVLDEWALIGFRPVCTIAEP